MTNGNDNIGTTNTPAVSTPAPTTTETRYIYLPLAASQATDEVNLVDLGRILWRRKWWIIFLTVLIATPIGAYLYTMAPVYTAKVSLLYNQGPLEADSSGGQEGGGRDKTASDTATSAGTEGEALAILKSRTFTERFIEDLDLLPLLFPDQWDAANHQWRPTSPQDRPPTLWEGYRALDSRRTVLQDRATGLTVLSVQWGDPELAAQWANTLVTRLNQAIRERDVLRADKSLEFLHAELAKTNVAELQTALYGMIEQNMKLIMLSNVRDADYVYTVIDPAIPPLGQQWTRLKRILAIAFVTVSAFVMISILVLIVSYLSQAGDKASRQK